MRNAISKYWMLNTKASLALFVAMTTSWHANAVEDGSSFYLLGSKGSQAGILAPAGTYLSIDNYFYSGDMSSTQGLPTVGGELEIGTDAEAFVALPSVLRVTDIKLFNGRLALGAVLPVINKDVSVDLTLDFDGQTIGGSESDNGTLMGDPVLLAILGWSEGNLHTTLNMNLNVPVGDYKEGDLINGGFNRWGLDTTLAFTYMVPDSQLELTIAPGITLNGKNRDTDYRSGNEFHIEMAAMHHLSAKYAVGLIGYHYQQIDSDSGTAPDGYKGRVSAIGPAANFNFMLGDVPVYGKAKYVYETNVKNRTEGSAVFLSFSVAL